MFDLLFKVARLLLDFPHRHILLSSVLDTRICDATTKS